MTSPKSNESTPPHHPTYGVELTDETISILIRHSLPGLTTAFKISRAPHGTSFNNKIYRLEPVDEAETNQSYVLKVNGRFFGAAKVENEVSCLLLLSHFCPDLPVPRIVAWSGDGVNITRWDAHNSPPANITKATRIDANVPGWILMTLLPGSRVDISNLSTEARSDLSSQVGAMLSSWRQNIPKSLHCANFHLQPISYDTVDCNLYPPGAAIGLPIYIYGFIEYGNDSHPPVTTLLNYWKTELEWYLGQLSSELIYSTNREPLLALLRRFLDDTLPRLSLVQDEQDYDFIFTHGDLFPRNILVQSDPPKISGVVDFEFSGFHPAMHEFTQEWLPNDDDSDWPPDMYETILEESERRGEVTPRSMSSIEWKQVKYLNALRNYIAPWWLAEGGKGDETRRQLQEAREEVEKAICELEQMVVG